MHMTNFDFIEEGKRMEWDVKPMCENCLLIVIYGM